MKTMKKRITAAALCMLMLLGLFPAGVLADGDDSGGGNCTITFDPCGGEGSMDPETVQQGTMYRLPANRFKAPEGTVFAFWVCDGKGWYPNSYISQVTGDMKFEARWNRYEDTYVNNVTWQNSDGTELDSKNYQDGEPEPTTDKVPSIAANSQYAYAFTGWMKPTGGGGGGAYPASGFPVDGGGGIVTVQRTIVQKKTTYIPLFKAVPVNGGDTVNDVLNGGVCGPAGNEDSVTWLLTADETLTISGKGKIQDYYTLPSGLQNKVQSVSLSDGVTDLGIGAFSGFFNLLNVYYAGTKAQWEAMSAYADQSLKNATIHCTDGILNIKYDVWFNFAYGDDGKITGQQAVVTCTNPDALILCAVYHQDGQMVSCDVREPSKTGKTTICLDADMSDGMRAVFVDKTMKPLFMRDTQGNTLAA